MCLCSLSLPFKGLVNSTSFEQKTFMKKEKKSYYFLFVDPACGERDIVVIISVRRMCVRPSVRICQGHNLYICA